MNDNNSIILIAEAKRELSDSDRSDGIKNWIKYNVFHKNKSCIDYIRWPNGILLMGLLSAGDKQTVSDWFDRWIDSGAKIYSVEDMLAGQVLLKLIRNGEERYQQAADAMAEYLINHEKDDKGNITYNENKHNYDIYADGIGMICPFLIGYGIMNKKKELIQEALLQITNFMHEGIDTETGLPFHGFRYENHEKYGIIGWGRAVGWLMLGMAESLRLLRSVENENTDKNYAQCIKMTMDEIGICYGTLCGAVISHMMSDGMCSWNLCDKSAEIDTSASAMILLALKKSLPYGHETEAEKMITRGTESIKRYITKNGKVTQCQAECGGFGIYPDKFGSYPWSVGTTLELVSITG